MKWFKHISNSSTEGQFISELEDRFGLEGYARWFKLLEAVALKMSKDSDYCGAAYSWVKWQAILKGKRSRLEIFLNFLEEKGQIILKRNEIISETNQEHSGNIPETFRKQTGNVSETKSEHSGNILEIEIPQMALLRDNFTKNSQVTDKSLTPKNKDKRIKIKEKEENPLTPLAGDRGCLPLKFEKLDLETAEWIFQKIKVLQPERKTPNFERWAGDVRLMREQDRRTHSDIKDLYDWVNRHPFWRTNILSPSKLREKWDDLVLRRKNDSTQVKTSVNAPIKPSDQWEEGIERIAKDGTVYIEKPDGSVRNAF